MLDDTVVIPFGCCESRSEDSEWNDILDFFDVISYEDPAGSAKNRMSAKTRGYAEEIFFYYYTPDTMNI